MFFVFFSMNLYVRGYHLYERVGLVGKALNTIEIFHNICLKGINGCPKNFADLELLFYSF